MSTNVQRVALGLTPAGAQLPDADAGAPGAQEDEASSPTKLRDHQSESLPNEFRRRNRSSQATKQPQSREEPHVLLWRPMTIKYDWINQIIC